MRTIGRYALFDEIASGGMASIHLGRLVESLGFTRTVAIKRLHPQFAKDAQFVAMFLDEARLAARVRHPNVVPTLDIVATPGELFLVMDYVAGETLARLLAASRATGKATPPRLVASIVVGVLNGLHAAHEATSDRGEPLEIVHRDVSPHNVLVGTDGVPRVIDFGVAKAEGRIHTTRDGKIKGKLAYMSPEQLQSAKIDRRTDIFAAGVVLWETLCAQRLFVGESEGATINKVLSAPISAPSAVRADLGDAFDAVTMRALERDPKKRFSTAKEMATALQSAIGAGGLAAANEIGEWVESIAGEEIRKRASLVASIENTSSSGLTPSDVDAIAARADSAPSREIGGEVSSLSVATANDREPVRRRGPMVAAIAIAAALAIGVGAFVLGKTRVPTATTSPPPPSTAPPPPTVIERVVIAAPPQTQSAVPIASTAPATAPRSMPRATAAPAASNCEPPYTYDQSGIKKYKPWCFGAH